MGTPYEGDLHKVNNMADEKPTLRHNQRSRQRATQANHPDRRTFLTAAGSVTGALMSGQLHPTDAATNEKSKSDHLIRFGHTDLWVTRYCQGTAFRQLPRSDNPETRRILERCLDVGINFFDSAEAYGWGGSETVLGRVIATHRDRVVVCTKAAPSRPAGKGTDPNKFTLGEKLPLTYDVLRTKVEGSLQRLRTDYIDLYLLHEPDGITPLNEIADSMESLVRSGKIRYWGVSNFSAANVEALNHHGDAKDRVPMAGTEDYFNIVARDPVDPRLLEVIGHTGMGLLAFSPQDTGRLSPGRQENKSFSPVIAALDAVARELGATRPQVCIAWVLSHPQVTCVLGGAENPAHIDDNFPGTELKLPREALETLNQASDSYRKRKKAATKE